MLEKKSYPIQHLVNWYFGNYCVRKCFDKDDQLRDHHQKLMMLAEKNPSLKMTHRDFLEMFNNEMKICTLDDSFKRKTIGWKLFTILQDTPNYDSNMIMVKKGIVQRNDGALQKPVSRCNLCKYLA